MKAESLTIGSLLWLKPHSRAGQFIDCEFGMIIDKMTHGYPHDGVLLFFPVGIVYNWYSLSILSGFMDLLEE